MTQDQQTAQTMSPLDALRWHVEMGLDEVVDEGEATVLVVGAAHFLHVYRNKFCPLRGHHGGEPVDPER